MGSSPAPHQSASTDRSTNKIDKGQAIIVATGHWAVDCYANFLSPLLPLLITKLNLTLVLAGSLVSLMSTLSAFSQPVFGYLSDRSRTRLFVVMGPFVTGVFMSLIGLAGSYSMLLVVLILGGIGVSAFHPQGASMAGKAGGDRRGLGMAFFATGGSLGMATGPILIITIVSNFGLESTYWAVLPGIIVTALLYRFTPRPETGGLGAIKVPSLVEQLSGKYTPLFLIWLISVLRSLVYVGFTTFMPVLFKERGFSLIAGGASVSVFVILGAVGGILSGYISDRVGRRNVIIYSSLIALPLFLAVLKSDGLMSYLFVALAGAFLISAVPVSVVMAQELIPKSAAVASSITLGMAWGVSAMGAAPIGALADRLGLESAFTILTYTLILPTILSIALPKDGKGLLSQLKLLVNRVKV